MYLTHKVCIQPAKSAIDLLWQTSYTCKDVWNILNDEKQRNRVGYYALKKMLPELKKDCPRLKEPCSQTLQEVVKSLTGAWRMYVTKKKQGDGGVGPPRFKSYKYFFTQKYPQQGISFEIAGNTLRLAHGKNKAEWIEIELPKIDYASDTIKTVTIAYDKVSKAWSASFTHEVSCADAETVSREMAGQVPALSRESFCPLPIAYNPFTREPVHLLYFDPGCKTALTGIKTDGTIHEYDINPLRQLNLKHYILIDQLKSRRDKKDRGSKQRRRLDSKIRKIYARVEGQSKHYLHKVANRILTDHPDVIGFHVGDWDKSQTLADTGYKFIDKRINRQVQNNNPIMTLVGYLSYKAALRCKEVRKFNERGTTRTCSCCGHVIAEGLSPSVRTFACPVCGFTIDRDINSTLNFLNIYQFAVWYSLRALQCLSIARLLLNPSSGKNRRVSARTCVLNYQDARSL